MTLRVRLIIGGRLMKALLNKVWDWCENHIVEVDIALKVVGVVCLLILIVIK
tara:strand:- start:1795 stop:1950 length:156 start_codon:yes stop_codon:yes gene_type:complete